MRQKEFGGLERARLIDRKLELSFERYRMMGERSEVLEEALFVVEEELPAWLPGFLGNVDVNQSPAGALFGHTFQLRGFVPYFASFSRVDGCFFLRRCGLIFSK